MFCSSLTSAITAASLGVRAFLVAGKPYFGEKRLSVSAMSAAASTFGTGAFLRSQRVMQFRQESSNRLTDQVAIVRRHQFVSTFGGYCAAGIGGSVFIGFIPPRILCWILLPRFRHTAESSAV